MPERNWSHSDASTQENRTEGARADVDALRAELGAFLYPVVSVPEARSAEESEEVEVGMDASILAGMLLAPHERFIP